MYGIPVHKSRCIPVQELDQILCWCRPKPRVYLIDYSTFWVTIASTIALPRGITAVVALGRSVRCDTGLNILSVHADTTYLIEYY